MFGVEPRAYEPTVDLKVLRAKIGQLALENDFLEGALIKVSMLNAKRWSIAATLCRSRA